MGLLDNNDNRQSVDLRLPGGQVCRVTFSSEIRVVAEADVEPTLRFRFEEEEGRWAQRSIRA